MFNHQIPFEDMKKILFVTRHAQSAFRKNHKFATINALIGEVTRGNRISHSFLQAITARQPKTDDSIYIQSSDNKGAFVICPNQLIGEVENNHPYVLVTYLRYSTKQKKFAEKYYI